MSQLTLNSIPSVDAIQRQARTKDRHVKYHALDTQHNFHLLYVPLWHNMDQTVFMQMLCIPPMEPRYAFEWHAWFYQTSMSTMCGLQPTLHRRQRHVLIEHVQRLKTLFGNNRVVLHLSSVRSPRLPRFTPEPRYTTRRQSTGALMTWPASSLRPLLATHTQARITWQPAPFFTRCIQHKTQLEKWLRIQRQNMSAICKPTSTAFSVGKLSDEWMDERLVGWYLSQFVPPCKCHDAEIFKISEKGEALTEVLGSHFQTTNGPLQSVVISSGPQ